ncbi:aldo/keto reductase [Pedobacter yonginense]|uniref:Aldo/keto reductase n=1 Tax=Pedobacter yonginense TaxID=651869 RepID=A0A317EJS2_9SPHI|nr:aldo/keto reductase [Pedobacter yonginense]PWS26113.1 aldo/keto reductase [Pedobacter yonginense]
MEYNLLGQTGLLVSEFCLGTMTFGDHTKFKGIGGLNELDAENLVKIAVDFGINFFDSANSYSDGRSEEMLGKSIKNLGLQRDSLIIATKVRMSVGKGPNDCGLSRKHILVEVEKSLKRLKTDYIDLYQIHAHDPSTSLEETLRVLDDLVRSGKVRYIGASNFPAWRLSMALSFSEFKNLEKFVALQAYYTVAARDLEREIIPLLDNQQLGLLIWSPLAGGLLSGKYKRELDKNVGRRNTVDYPPVNLEKLFMILDVLKPIADAHNVSVAQVSLAWLLQQKAVTSIIIGAKNKVQLEDNIKSSSLNLTDSELKKINEISKLSPEYPGWVIEYSRGNRKRYNL